MRIKLKQREELGQMARKCWPRSVSGSPRWSEEVPEPVSIDSARWPLLPPSWVYPSALVEVMADLPFEVLFFWDSRPGSREKVKDNGIPLCLQPK